MTDFLRKQCVNKLFESVVFNGIARNIKWR